MGRSADDKIGVNREIHAPFCGSPGVRSPQATRPTPGWRHGEQSAQGRAGEFPQGNVTTAREGSQSA